jgi:hypothetical protein
MTPTPSTSPDPYVSNATPPLNATLNRKCKMLFLYSSSNYDVLEELAWNSVLSVVVRGVAVLPFVISSSILGISSGIRNGFETTSS